MIAMKKCSKCNKVKATINFCVDKKSKDGLQSQCKVCKNKQLCEYYKTNPNKRSKSSSKSELNKYYKNKISRNISRRIRYSLNGIRKGVHWERLLGYSLQKLKKHLEINFTKKMNWLNYGTYWHIDHILPVSSFNIVSTSCADFKKCWALENLQPLEAKENISKSNKIYEILH